MTLIAPVSSERTFGVEIECGHNGGSAEVEELLWNHPDKAIKEWGNNVGIDGSGVEVRSPILKGVEGFRQLHTVMTFLKKNNAYVTNADGMHVHVGAPEFVNNQDAIIRANESYYLNQAAINKLVQTNRTGPRAYNPEMRKQDVDEIKRGYAGYRMALNTSNLERGGLETIEFRQFAGCLDPVAAEAWIRFCLRFTDEVSRRKNPIASCAAVDDLLRRMRLGESVKKQLKKPPKPPNELRAGVAAAARRPVRINFW